MTHPQGRIWERGKERDPLETLEKKTALILAFQSPELGGHKHLFLAPTQGSWNSNRGCWK